MAAPEKQSGCG